MPTKRILGQKGSAAVYHCMSRAVGKQRVFGEAEREELRTQLWKVAQATGVPVLTYAILSNHFHVLVKVPDREQAEAATSNDELIRRYRILYPLPPGRDPLEPGMLERIFADGGDPAQRQRGRLLAWMHRLPEFMKLVKQRYSIWFNRTHGRVGTLWAERYRSALVEHGRGYALRTVAAYIDLNPVRAGLVGDPKDYRWCGYAEAVGGARRAQLGLLQVMNGGQSTDELSGWEQAGADYRVLLYDTGAQARPGAAVIPAEKAQAVIDAAGKLSLQAALRCRARVFTDGAVLGSRTFVQAQLLAYRSARHQRLTAAVQPLPACGAWGDLVSLRGWRSVRRE